ncbi:MAG: hypothetical protein ABI172_03115 [Ginsengibacter sp.]|jgi:hypothetical protein
MYKIILYLVQLKQYSISMTAETTPKLCLSCNKTVRGRTDKKFCDDYCRNNYNNQLKSNTINLVRNINNALGKNRRILESIFSGKEEITKITKDRLLEKGFLFKYITHTYTNKKGSVYYFCYDIGYLPLENNWYLLVKRKKE